MSDAEQIEDATVHPKDATLGDPVAQEPALLSVELIGSAGVSDFDDPGSLVRYSVIDGV